MVLLSCLLACCLLACSAPPKPAAAKVTQPVAKSSETLFQENCAVCHGTQGRGDGIAAYLLNPKPRDFEMGLYRLVSTDNGRASESDIARTITQGMPGTSMPPWPNLSKTETRGLAQYLLKFRKRALTDRALARGKDPVAAEAWALKRSRPGTEIEIPAAPPPASPDELKSSFIELCASCHADDGTGKNDPSWRTETGFPIVSRNFRRGVFKGGRDDESLYRRIAAGMPGTPMPGYALVPPEQIWNMVRYIQSLSDPQEQEDAWVDQEEIVVRRAAKLPSVNDAIWQSVTPTKMALLPLWAGDGAIQKTRLRAIHTKTHLAVLLEWDDPSRDLAERSDAFPDGAALQLSSDSSPPPFAMGHPGAPVELWHWQTRSKNRKPGRAGEYSAEQFGTLTDRAPDAESVHVASVWKDGRWRLMFSRALHTKRTNDLELRAETLSVAVALWDGRLGDRNGKKSVSTWHPIILE
jgi:DMSO reductase family type II enzyme heme b subunit